MAASTTHPRFHAVARAVARVELALDDVTDASVWSLDPEETAATLVRLTAAVARVSELELRVAAHADSIQVGEQSRATSTANWWAHQTRQTRPEAHRKISLGTALAAGHHPVRVALAAGDVSVEQAGVIVQAVERLPADTESDVVDRAERHLVAEAQHHDPRALRILGKRLLEVVAPDVADAHEAKLLEREEAQAGLACRLAMTDRGDGTTHGTFTLPTPIAEAWKKALLAISAPKHRAATDGRLGQRRPGPERMGRALCEYIDRYPDDRLPDAGGRSATVVVTMTLETLMGGLKAAQLDTGARISPGAARKMACEAGIIPVVLGGRSEVLDVGRTKRFHTRSMRIAMALRDGGCTADGCDWPPGMCHSHHDVAWSKGGGTSVGRFLCPRHHARAHDPSFTMTKLPGGKVAFTRRT